MYCPDYHMVEKFQDQSLPPGEGGSVIAWCFSYRLQHFPDRRGDISPKSKIFMKYDYPFK